MKNLSERSILVSLNVSKWSARKYDKKITEEVNSNHNTSNAGRFNKLLVEKSAMKEISELEGKLRDFHYANTLPWGDNGERLLPTENYFNYVDTMGGFKMKFETAVKKFIDEYPTIIQEAKARLNGMFHERDYPKDIGNKFAVKIGFMPVPESGDIRVQLSEEEINLIKNSVENEINQRFSAAQKSIYTRVADQLQYMHEKLITKDSIFRDSLFNNILSLVDLLPRLNVSGDNQINELCEDLRKLYCTPQNVREDSKLREQKAKEVDKLLSKIADFI